MTDSLAHRGPDGRGVWRHPTEPLFLGHRRLSIIDLEGGAQPMVTPEADLVISYNGEIYNHAELRAELENLGHRFRTDHSDTEVLLYAYRQWGPAMQTRLNGMWAFAIFDAARKRLFLSRDRFGKKPLFYAHRRDCFVFGSELTALLEHPCVAPEVSKVSLQKYFAYGYIPAPRSLYEGIHKLPGGHSLTFSLRDASITIEKYWDFVLEPFARVPAHAEAEWGEELLRLLECAVRRRLVADVDLGIFLSGGIDSSTVAALAARCSPVRVKTFTIGFEDPTFDESAYAAAAAAAIGSDHRCEVLSMERSRALLPGIVGRLDEPMGDSSLLPTYLVSQVARKGVTVVLGGDGADELFAGYDPVLALSRANLYRKLVPGPVHEAISLAVSMLPVSHRNMSFDFRIKRTLRGLGYPPRLWSPVWMAPLSPAEIRELFGEDLEEDELYSEAIDAWESCPQDNLVDKVTQFFVKLYLQDDILVKTDRAGMMHGLEVRAPFLDIDLVDFVRRIPWQYKLRNGRTKHILRWAVRDLLPPSILNRPKKGFGVPIGRWFRDGKLELSASAGIPYLEREVVDRSIRAHRRNRVDQRLFLWDYWLLTKHRAFSTGPAQCR